MLEDEFFTYEAAFLNTKENTRSQYENPSPSHRGHLFTGSITVLGGRRGHTVRVWRARATSTAATAAVKR